MNYEYLILGGGAAALQMGYFFNQSQTSYLVLEKNKVPGSFFTHFPRQRGLISINKAYAGHGPEEEQSRYDWNYLLGGKRFSKYSQEFFPNADKLVEYLADYASSNNINIKYDTEVIQVSKDTDGFRLRAKDGTEYRSKRLIVATGFDKEHVPNFPNSHLCETYGNFDQNSEGFKNKKVLIIGTGNSGFEVATSIIDHTYEIHICSPTPVRVSTQSHYVGDVRALNTKLIENY